MNKNTYRFFEIGEQVIKEQYLGCYVVEIKTMYGDADGYGKITVGGFKEGEDEDLLNEFLDLCERMETFYPNGRGGEGDYDQVEGFEKWFKSYDLDPEDWDAMTEREKRLYGDNEWEDDPNGYGDQATYCDAKVYWYSYTGAKYNVDIVK